jgi:hypothetical protein
MAEYVTDPADVSLRRVPKVGPGWNEGYAEGIANGIRQGIDEGHAKGWVEGYDEGIEAGQKAAVADTKAVAADALREAQARAAAPLRVNAHANQVIGAMLAAVDANNATVTHRGDCWKIHPACALRAVRKALV